MWSKYPIQPTKKISEAPGSFRCTQHHILKHLLIVALGSLKYFRYFFKKRYLWYAFLLIDAECVFQNQWVLSGLGVWWGGVWDSSDSFMASNCFLFWSYYGIPKNWQKHGWGRGLFHLYSFVVLLFCLCFQTSKARDIGIKSNRKLGYLFT